jgi:chemotaxis protein MotB
MSGKKKRGPAEDHENHERWLLTYADMITLLVAFFIMLYAMSVMNITKFQMLAISGCRL